MQDLVLTIYDDDGTDRARQLFTSGPVINFTAADLALQQGNGNSVFNFGLDAAQQAQFDALLGSGRWRYVSSQDLVQATLGCPAASPLRTCLVSNDGPDSFVAFVQPGTGVPEPGTLLLAGTALVGVMAFARKKLHRTGTPGSA